MMAGRERRASACDGGIGDLIDVDKPVSLDPVTPPSDILRTKPLLRPVLN